jgi:2-aminoethylphosphonate-pyruvate transaminase
MIITAVILAAGLGSRLKHHTQDKPKGFLVLDKLPIIEESIQKLISAGISKILIGVGYKQEFYHLLAAQYPQVSCIENSDFASTGSMYTLACLQEQITQDFLLLESDLIYQQAALDTLIDYSKPNCILATDITDYGDEVFIQTDNLGKLVNMAKDPSQLAQTNAVLVGINKISYPALQAMCVYLATSGNNKLDYEDALIAVSKQQDIDTYIYPNILAMEIDDENHLERAQQQVYPAIARADNLPQVKRNILLNPGPATTTDSVKYAQVVPDICPREKEFGLMVQDIAGQITNIAANTLDYASVLFAGSGTCAVEAMLCSLIAENKKILIVDNGAYGKRMCDIAKVYNLDLIEFKSSQIAAIDLTALEHTIKQHQEQLGYIACVHHETTTGLANNLTPIGALCKRYNLKLLVDAMSSFAAMPIDMPAQNIHAIAASSNKNIQAMAGISFVCVAKELLEASAKIHPRSYYLNLYAQHEYFVKSLQLRFTPPVQTFYALRQALRELALETVPARYARYSQCWQVLVAGLKHLKLTYLVADTCHGKLITAICEPDIAHYNFNDMHEYLYKRGITIYPGKLALQNTFRIANIGALDTTDIELFLARLADYLNLTH